MLSPFGCAACGRGLYVLSGRLGKLRQAAALLIDKGEVLGAGTVRIKRRKRLLDIRIDLPGSKDLVVLATLGGTPGSSQFRVETRRCSRCRSVPDGPMRIGFGRMRIPRRYCLRV